MVYAGHERRRAALHEIAAGEEDQPRGHDLVRHHPRVSGQRHWVRHLHQQLRQQCALPPSHTGGLLDLHNYFPGEMFGLW